MPPPETKSVAFEKPSLLALVDGKDPNHVMIPTPLRTMLDDISSESSVGLVLLPQFGYLYGCLDSKILEYDVNLLETKLKKFQIQKTKQGDNTLLEIAQPGVGTSLFRFGVFSEESLKQARIVGTELESFFGYPIAENL